MAARRKVAILGIDGGDIGLFRRWIAKGLLPNFGRLAERGRIGVLQSTYPPVTAPAWISLMTGEQPGSHGVVGFTTPVPGEYTRNVVNSSSVESPLLWEIVSGYGGKSIVVNVPLTYPIRPLNGILVAGMLTPEGVGFTYPAAYETELRLLQPDYRIDLAWQDYRERGHDLVRDQKSLTHARADLCLKLLRTKPWDLFMVVFTGTDRLQHCLFRHVERIDDDAAVRGDSLTAAVRDYYVSLDERIGDLVKAAGEDTNFFVVSDHGFGSLEYSVYFNRWLAEEGLLALKPKAQESLRRWKRALNRIGVRRATLVRWGRALGLGRVVEQKVQTLNPFVGGIEWSRTQVYYFPTNGFFVNLKGRDPFGTVEPGAEYEAVRDDLIRRLEALRDPVRGERLIPTVKRREEIFAGRSVERLPDVFIEFLDRPCDAYMHDYDVPEIFKENLWGDGTHRRDGLYIGAGPDLAAGGDAEGLEIFDIAPNVLHLMGYSIPEHMDGRFRPDLLGPEAEREARFEAFTGASEGRVGITPQEERDLEDELRRLGYL